MWTRLGCPDILQLLLPGNSCCSCSERWSPPWKGLFQCGSRYPPDQGPCMWLSIGNIWGLMRQDSTEVKAIRINKQWSNQTFINRSISSRSWYHFCQPHKTIQVVLVSKFIMPEHTEVTSVLEVDGSLPTLNVNVVFDFRFEFPRTWEASLTSDL